MVRIALPIALAALLPAAAGLVAGCSEGAPEPGFEPRATTSPTRQAPATTTQPPDPPQALAPADPSAPPPPGRWYTLSLPEGASRTVSAAPDIVDATYVLDAEERVMLAIFRPMPQQTDLELWTTATEGLLDGIPVREDDARIGDVPARLGTFPSELRWTFVADGWGGLVKCYAESPRDEAWLHEHCDPTVRTLSLDRPLRP